MVQGKFETVAEVGEAVEIFSIAILPNEDGQLFGSEGGLAWADVEPKEDLTFDR